MALSALNKNFLSTLNKLDIDVKQFPDKSFDGCFEFVPDSMCHFFNWFLDNVTPDNALTQREKATYFALESSGFLPNEEEANFVLSSCQPSYEELKSVDLSYANSLPEELDALRRYQDDLLSIKKNFESSYDEAKKSQISLKERIRDKKKELDSEWEVFLETNSILKARVNKVKLFLLKLLSCQLRLDIFNELLPLEDGIFNKLSSVLIENRIFDCSNLDSLPELEKNLAYVKLSSILSNGFLQVKKAKLNFLSELLQKSSTNYKYLIDTDGMDRKLNDEIKLLESNLFEKIKKISNDEVQKIVEDYLVSKADLCKSYTSKLISIQEYLKLNSKLSSCLLHVLLRTSLHLEETIHSRKRLHSELNKHETHLTNDLTNLELRQQRFSEIASHQNKHPLLSEIENPESLENVFNLTSQANEDSDAIRSQLQLIIKKTFDETLCGPTDEVFLVPLELLIRFQDEKNRVGGLSQAVKRHASKYVETKEKISKQQRKEVLSWINFIKNLQRG